MPKIIVEGPDGAGKTTLCEELRAAAGKRYFVMLRHSCRPLTFDHCMWFYRTLLQAPKPLTFLVDRHAMISEPIYGPLLRKHNLIGTLSHGTVLGMLAETADVIIYCRPPDDVIRAGIRSQPQLAGVFDHIDGLIESYDNYMEDLRRNTSIRVINYDWTTPESLPYLKEQLLGTVQP